MAVTYASGTKLRTRLSIISGASALLTDAQIDHFIEMSEGILNSIMRHSFVSTFDSSKHGIIEDTTEALGAYMALTNGLVNYTSTSQSALAADLLWGEADRGMGILSDQRTIEYLKSL